MVQICTEREHISTKALNYCWSVFRLQLATGHCCPNMPFPLWSSSTTTEEVKENAQGRANMDTVVSVSPPRENMDEHYCSLPVTPCCDIPLSL